MASSLNDDRIKNLRVFYMGDEDSKLIGCKGILPYEYIDGWKTFEGTKLLLKNTFHSKLYINNIIDQDNEDAQDIWNKITPEFENVILSDYYDLYLPTDALPLSDVFENFRDVCLQHCKFNPVDYYTVSELAWQAALRYTRKLKLLRN